MSAKGHGAAALGANTTLDLLRPSRRELLKTGVLGCAALAIVGLAAGAWARAQPIEGDFTFLTPEDRVIVAAIAPVMLAGALPAGGAERASAEAEVVLGVDRAISGLAPATQAELRQLFDLLGLGIARVLVAGLWPSWDEAGAEDIAGFLERWRTSRFDLLRSAYLGLHELIIAAWYGNPRAWPGIGYPGPPELG
ncbi:MAG: hypothetical protein O7A68_02480 [Alphaproteobacteria bacterium]|nr:hypothetical protein [Alphaproteobacteria bacterium]